MLARLLYVFPLVHSGGGLSSLVGCDSTTRQSYIKVVFLGFVKQKFYAGSTGLEATGSCLLCRAVPSEIQFRRRCTHRSEACSSAFCGPSLLPRNFCSLQSVQSLGAVATAVARRNRHSGQGLQCDKFCSLVLYWCNLCPCGAFRQFQQFAAVNSGPGFYILVTITCRIWMAWKAPRYTPPRLTCQECKYDGTSRNS